VFPVCRRCATTKRWSGFGARLGERGDESFYFNSMAFSLHYCWGRELRSFVVNGLEGHAIQVELHSVFDMAIERRAG